VDKKPTTLIELICPRCGRKGTASLDPSVLFRAPEDLLNLSDEFYLRMPKSRRGPLQLACSKCDAVLD
jgi:hypothetical protein